MCLPELTQYNHFQFGYNDVVFNHRYCEHDRWWTKYGVIRREPMDFRSECISTAKQIAEYAQTLGKKPVLFFSGGIDSEVMANAFYSAHIDFEIVTLRYCDIESGINNNDFDTFWAEQWTKPRSRVIQKKHIHEIAIDIPKLWKSDEFMDICMMSGSISPQFSTYMYAIDLVAKNRPDLFPVFGSAECHLERNRETNKNRPHMFEREKVASVYRFMFKRGYDGVPGFFQYTPELMLSFLEDPMVKAAVLDKDFTSTWNLKYDLYSRHFDLAKRLKYNGFECFMGLDETIRAGLLSMNPAGDSVTYHDYETLCARLRGKMSW